MKKTDKYDNMRSKVRLMFDENKQRYGYRRIYGLLKRENITVSEKNNSSNHAGRWTYCQQQTTQEK